MGQANKRGTFEQRRQRAISKAMPDASPSTLNHAYKEPGRFGTGMRNPFLAAVLAISTLKGNQ